MSHPDNSCEHKNKKATDSENYDGEVFWSCPDCGCGWREEARTEEEKRMAEEIDDKNDRLDAAALGLDYDKLLRKG
jgi:Zn-finger protein